MKKMIRQDPLKYIREQHNLKYNTLMFGDDHYGLPSYFSGWADISHLVSKAFGKKSVSRIENIEEAQWMARELSDVFFKYFCEEEKR